MTDNIRDKTRAVFLAAIMVLSMVAMSATFAGAAAASNVDHDLDDNEVEVTEFDFDDATIENALLSEEIRYIDSFVDDRNVGPVMGLPVHTGFYDDEETHLRDTLISEDGEEDGFANQEDQFANAELEFDANVTDQDVQIIHDIGEANDAGLDVTEDTTVTLPDDEEDTFVEALADATDDNAVEQFPDTSESGLAGLPVSVEDLNRLIAQSDNGIEDDLITVNNDVGEVIINLPASVFGDDGVDEDFSTELGIGLNFVTSDLVEGIDLEDNLEDIGISAEGNTGSAEDDAFLFFESGVTGLTPADAENWEETEEIDARIDFNNDENSGDDGAVGQFVGADLTVQTPVGDTVEVYEAVRESDGDNYTLGDRVWNEDTSPSNTQTIDTEELGEGEYFIGFEERDDFDENEYIFLDLRDLEMNASTDEPWTEEETIEIDVETEETDAIRDTGDVQLWISDAGDEAIADVNYVDRDELLGVTGDTSFDVDPMDDLDGEGEYRAVVLHEDSGIVTETEFEVIEPEDENVEIVSPETGDEAYDRGDIFEVEAELENTERATITLGDRDEQNVEINVTLRDTDESGDVSFMVNTFQIGDGEVDGQNDDYATADHGIRTTDDGTAISNIEAHEAMEIGGGSASTAHAEVRDRVVIADGTYDIVASPGRTSHKAEDSFSTDRSVFRLDQGEVEDLELWNSPFPGDRRAIAGADKVDAIFDGQDEGLVNPQDARMADNDVLVMGVEAGGLEGFLLNALEVEDEDEGFESDVIEDFLDREDDHYVTDAFDAVTSDNLDGYTVGDDAFGFNTTQTEADLADREEERNIRGLQPARLGLDEEEILADVDEDTGSLSEYYVTIQVEEDNIVEPNEREDVAKPLPAEWNTTFNLDVEIADGSATEFPLNDFFGDDVIQTTEWTLYDDDITIDDVEDDILSVPARDNTTISGETEIAAGTLIDSETQTASGEDPPFFYPNSFTVEYVEDAPNTIEFSEDFEGFEGADFSVNLRRARSAGSLANVDGEVRETSEVIEHEFNDQERGGETVIVDRVEVNQRGYIQIQDADGDVLATQQISEGVTENSRILLDEEIEESQELDSVIVDRDGEEFQEGDVRQSAQYTVRGDAAQINAFFDVDNLDPRTATVEPEDELTVSATVENVEGAADNTQTIEFRLDGETVDSQELTLEPDETETVEFEVTAPEDEGSYTHAIASEDTRDTGTLTVEAEEDEDDADDEPADDDDDDADDDGAGFGIAAALIALLGAALLAYRRQVE